jgi:hypothetical protein
MVERLFRDLSIERLERRVLRGVPARTAAMQE